MRFAIIDTNSVVTNITTADQEFGESQGWISAGDASIGDLYENGQFITPHPPPPPVPQSVSMRQARLALLSIGKLADVDTAIAAMPSPDKEAAQVEWEYAAEVQRNSALVLGLIPALGLTEQQTDELFIQAATL
jgi:hypothetical protein